MNRLAYAYDRLTTTAPKQNRGNRTNHRSVRQQQNQQRFKQDGGHFTNLSSGYYVPGEHQITIAGEHVPPEQFFPQRKWTPEQTLCAAVLECALSDMRLNITTRGKRMRQEAIAWILSDSRTSPFSFLNICDVLVLGDAEQVRKRLVGEQR
jgi:hypothetical protein